MARIKKGINYLLSKIVCKKQNVLEETMDNISDVYVKENISDHTLSELSNTQDFLKDKEKSSGTEKNTMTENESQSLIPSPSVSETVPIASEESDIENPDNKEIQSKSGDGSSKEVSCFNIMVLYCWLMALLTRKWSNAEVPKLDYYPFSPSCSTSPDFLLLIQFLKLPKFLHLWMRIKLYLFLRRDRMIKKNSSIVHRIMSKIWRHLANIR